MDGKEYDRPYRRNADDAPRVQEFQARHRRFSDRVERFLMQLVILGLVALVLVQTLQVIPALRRQMNVTEALEGVSANELGAWAAWGAQGQWAAPSPQPGAVPGLAAPSHQPGAVPGLAAPGPQPGAVPAQAGPSPQPGAVPAQAAPGPQQGAVPGLAAPTGAGPFTVTVMLVSQRSAPGAKLLVDGKAAGAFDTGSVTVTVKPGQVLSVDGTGSRQALTFRIIGAAGLTSPEVGASVTTHGDRQRLGSVQPGR